MSWWDCKLCGARKVAEPIDHLVEMHPDVRPTMASVWEDFTLVGSTKTMRRLPAKPVPTTWVDPTDSPQLDLGSWR